jgi:inorganic pyrophosphatase
MVVDRLKHYFLTYKDLPGNPRDVEITDVFGKEDAYEIIKRSMNDYTKKFENLGDILSSV